MSKLKSEYKTILVTGAGGYLGSALVKHLCELGHHVIALYRSSLPEAHSQAFPVCIDLEQENLLASPLRGVDLVIHAAWEKNFIGPKNNEDSSLHHSVNLQSLQKLLKAIEKGLEIPDSELPEKQLKPEKGQINNALADLLRVLLKSCSENTGVASKLIATAGDLDALAAGDRNIDALNGWRFEVFGQSALQLCDGKIGLAVKGVKVKTFQL